MVKATEHPKVFISYSWEDKEHIEWAKRLADCLIENGVDAHIDQYDLELVYRIIINCYKLHWF